MIDRVKVHVGARRDHVERPAETYIRNGLLRVGDVYLADGLCGLDLPKHEMAGAGEGAALGEYVDVGVNRDDLGLPVSSARTS